MPGTVLMKKFRPSIFISALMTLWGLVTIFSGFVVRPHVLLRAVPSRSHTDLESSFPSTGLVRLARRVPAAARCL